MRERLYTNLPACLARSVVRNHRLVTVTDSFPKCISGSTQISGSQEACKGDKSRQPQVGAQNASHLVMSQPGGNSPQMLVNQLSEELASGRASFGLVAGGECLSTFMRAVKEGRGPRTAKAVRDVVGREYQGASGAAPLPWGDKSDPVGPTMAGETESLLTLREARHGLAAPTNTYALLDQALRHHLGRTAGEHMVRHAELFAGFSSVAASPEMAEHAWFPTARAPAELATVTAENRPVTVPGYPKYLNAFQDVDMAAAVLLTTASEAIRLGVPRSSWVFIHACADANEAPFLVSERPELHRCRAIHAMGRELSRAAGVPLGRCELLDIYSCFPVAVEVACRELGLERQSGQELTVTGGLPFYGGAGNAYSMFSIVAMCEKLRARPGAFGLLTANGGFLTKHSGAVYSTVPYRETHPEGTWWRTPPAELQRSLDQEAGALVVDDGPSGRGVVETCTVEHSREGPARAIFIGRLLGGEAAGRRFLATSRDPAVMTLVMGGNGCGATGVVSTEKERSTFTPERARAVDLPEPVGRPRALRPLGSAAAPYEVCSKL